MQLEKKLIKNLRDNIRKNKLIEKNEKVLVALSGGKDSTACAYFLKKLGYNINGFHIDLKLGDYSEKCFKAVKKLCEFLDIKLYVYDIKKQTGSSMCYIRNSVQEKNKTNSGCNIKNCAVCGVIKKWILNKKARELKADKIATGHHLDDESQTFFLNILKGSLNLSSNTGPITKNISDKKFIPRIKPLFYVSEKNIKKFTQLKKLPVIYEKCPCATDSYRLQVRKFFDNLSDKDKKNIIKNFDEISPILNKFKSKKIKYCEYCREPSRKNICKKCEFLITN